MGLDHERNDRTGDDGGSPDDRRGLRGAEPQLTTATEAVWPGVRSGDSARTGLECHTAPMPDESLRTIAKAGTVNSVRIGRYGALIHEHPAHRS